VFVVDVEMEAAVEELVGGSDPREDQGKVVAGVFDSNER
jgi:hypothetical protein